MSLNAPKSEKKQRPIAPVGTHAAVCFAIIDMGQHVKTFGKESKVVPLVHFGWEFTNLPHQVFDETKGPQPMAIFQEYTVSVNDKSKLFQALNSWRGVPPVDLAKELPIFLGQPCLINVVHNPDKTTPGITYANIANNGTGIMRLPQGMAVNPMKNEKIFFNLDAYSHDQFAKLPAWIQKKIQTCQEWSGIVARFGQPPQPQQQTQQNNQQGFTQNNQQQGFGQQQNQGFQQNTGFNQNQGFQQQTNQPPVNNGNIVTGNPFDEKPPF